MGGQLPPQRSWILSFRFMSDICCGLAISTLPGTGRIERILGSIKRRRTIWPSPTPFQRSKCFQ
jgi:hypothetical protein